MIEDGMEKEIEGMLSRPIYWANQHMTFEVSKSYLDYHWENQKLKYWKEDVGWGKSVYWLNLHEVVISPEKCTLNSYKCVHVEKEVESGWEESALLLALPDLCTTPSEHVFSLKLKIWKLEISDYTFKKQNITKLLKISLLWKTNDLEDVHNM